MATRIRLCLFLIGAHALMAEGPIPLFPNANVSTHGVSVSLTEEEVFRVEITGADPYFIFPNLPQTLETADYTGVEFECRAVGKNQNTRVSFFFGMPFTPKRRAAQAVAATPEWKRVLVKLAGNAPDWTGSFNAVRLGVAGEPGQAFEFRKVRLVQLGEAYLRSQGEAIAAAAKVDGRPFGLSLGAVAPIPPKVLARVAQENGATTWVASYSPEVDLMANTREGDPDGNDVILPPPMVCGQGPDPLNHTVVRILSRHGLCEVQFLAFPPDVRGGVDVATGRGKDNGAFFAAAPLLDPKVRAVRVFSRHGIALGEIQIPDPVSAPFAIACGDINGDGAAEILVTARAEQKANQTVLAFEPGGKLLSTHSMDGVPAGRQEGTLSCQAGRIGYFLAKDRTLFVQDPRGGKGERQDLSKWNGVGRAFLGSDGRTVYGDEADPVLSRLRVRQNGVESLQNAGARENLLHLAPQGAWGVKKVMSIHGDTEISRDMFKAGQYLPKARFAFGRVYLYHDYMDGKVETPRTWEQVTQGPVLREFVAKELGTWDTQEPAVWEPTFTARYGKWEGTANLFFPGTRLPKYLMLDRRNEVPIYSEGGRGGSPGTYHYWENEHLKKACLWPVRYYMRELVKKQRQAPERFLGIEPSHEMEIACDRPDSVGDYNPYGIQGFLRWLLQRYGSLSRINAVFKTSFTETWFDAPRDFARGEWDGYADENPFFRAWIAWNTSVINRVLCDLQREALMAGFPPESISAHQIPDLYAVGDVAAFASTATRRITPIDWLFTSGCGFGFTRYGLWYQKPADALASGWTSGFGLQTLGEYAPKTKSVEEALAQYRVLWSQGASFLHLMAWDPAKWPGENQAAWNAWNQFVQENDKPRPGVAGGILKVVPGAGGNMPVLVSLGTGPDRTGLIKSLAADGGWEGSVYVVPFHSLIAIESLDLPKTLDLGSPQRVSRLADIHGGTVVELSFTAQPTVPCEVRLTPVGAGGPQPQLAATMALPAGAGRYRLLYRFTDRAEDLTLELSASAPVALQSVQGAIHRDKAAQTRMGRLTGERARGGVMFDVFR